jgi:aspartyl-tRNA(Asn)/glutamyl-tRNA(Gln) amidotransferase subunit B
LGKLLDLVANKTISGRSAKDVFQTMVETGDEPDIIVNTKALTQIDDEGHIKNVVDSVVQENQPWVEQYRAGKTKIFGAFVGQVMKATGGRANPALVNDALKRKLAES